MWLEKVNIAVKWWENIFNKEIGMTKEDNENLVNIRSVTKIMLIMMLKYHCHITGKHKL